MAQFKIHKLFDEYIKEVQKYYPALRYSGSFAMYSGDEPPGAELRLASDTYLLKDTLHAIEEKGFEIVHFTSLSAGLSIVDSGEIWLSQIDRCNDVKELQHAFSMEPKADHKDLQSLKKKYFITSFGEYQNLSEDDEFMMWRCYGKDGNGIALVFEIENQHASTYLFGKVVYGDKSLSIGNFRDFLRFDQEFRKKHPGVIQNKYFNELIMVSLLLKTGIWKSEREVRLIGYHNYDKWTLEAKDYDLKNSMLAKVMHKIEDDVNHRVFLRFPLSGTPQFNDYSNNLKEHNTDLTIANFLPVLKLKKVIIGHRIGSKYLGEMEIVINKALKKFDYTPQVQFSRLNKYF